ncbi:hypothetical protein TDB9533_02043 [Thalassocella blandensis]|nr:hypothetical protein TDB9533_02043 [Thalassocella blandensis]
MFKHFIANGSIGILLGFALYVLIDPLQLSFQRAVLEAFNLNPATQGKQLYIESSMIAVKPVAI